MIKAVIFDMDGLMIESENLQSEAFGIIIKKYEINPIKQANGLIQTPGLSERANWEILKKKHNLKEDTDILIKKRNPIYLDILKKNIVSKPGLIKLIKLLRNEQILLAVASSSGIEHIESVLGKLVITKEFNAVVSGQFIKNSKPAPDIFLEAAKQLGVKTNECLVLEDAESGVEAGHRAGMEVIAVPNKYTKDNDFSKADLTVKSLESIDLSIINMLK
ncbi:MAG: HAD family phosphatase [Patescibacteria group bacterium]